MARLRLSLWGGAMSLGVGFVLYFIFPVADGSRRELGVYVPASVSPIAVSPAAPNVLPLPRCSVERLCERILPQSGRRLAPSTCVHLLHLRGDVAALPVDFGSPEVPLLDVLLNSDLGTAWFGAPALLKTRYGARFTSLQEGYRDGEAHRDQCLALLAELSIPLTRSLFISGEHFTVWNLLNDSLAEFHLDQQELAWSASAYAIYLPPATDWHNRFGERFTFDGLVRELLKRPANESSCYGMHEVSSLSVICQVDRRCSILSHTVRLRLVERLRSLVDACMESQDSDGSWAFDWHVGVVPRADRPYQFSPPDNMETRLLVTGHIAEWLQLLPGDLQPPIENQLRAAGWLYGRLCELSEGVQIRNICPYVHAARALMQWSRPRDMERGGRQHP